MIENDKQGCKRSVIRRLLAKASATDSDQEAELLRGKARDLMRKYAITDLELATESGQMPDGVTSCQFMLMKQYAEEYLVLYAAICRGLGDAVCVIARSNVGIVRVTLIGSSQKLREIKNLFRSAQQYAHFAMTVNDITDPKAQYTFFLAYARTITARLEARQKAREPAKYSSSALALPFGSAALSEAVRIMFHAPPPPERVRDPQTACGAAEGARAGQSVDILDARVGYSRQALG